MFSHLSNRNIARKQASGFAMLPRTTDRWKAMVPYGKQEKLCTDGSTPLVRALETASSKSR